MTTLSPERSGTMTAAVVEEHGDVDQVQVKDWPVPWPRPHEVRIRVAAAAINRADLGLVRGLVGPGIRARHLPVIPGVDFAGVIDVVGEDAAAGGWLSGQRVVVYSGIFCGSCRACRRGEETMCEHYQILGEEVNGGFAEYTVVPMQNLKRMPDDFPFDVAAAAPVAFTTAWRMLMNRGGMLPGDRVLVVGVGSGVSTAAIALARRFGARIFGTTRETSKAERALALGVEAMHVGYDEPFDDWVLERTNGEGVDIVVDSVGAATWRQSIRSLATGGKLVICGATSGDNPDISIREVYQRHRQILGAPCGNLREFHRVMDLVFSGEVTPVIDRTFPLARIQDAMRHLQGQEQFGKIIVTPR